VARVLHVALSLNPGGAERLVIELCRRLAGEVQSAVCCLDDKGCWANELEREGVQVVPLGRHPGFRPMLAREIAHLAARFGADVLHCHEYSPFVYGTLSQVLRPSVRVISTEHGRLDDRPATIKRRIGTRMLNWLPSTVVAVSRSLRTRLVAEGFPASRVRVVLNGIDPGPPPAPELRRQARARLGLHEEELVIGAVGRLAAVKDFSALIAAFGLLRSLPRRARLVIVGDGPERAALAAQARAANVSRTVLFTGHQRDTPALMPAFDIFVNSSIYEGVSLTVLEAMAASVPVLATAVGGTPEILQDGVNGRLIPSRSFREMASAIAALARDPELCRRLGAAGRSRVLQSFHIDRMVRTYAGLYASQEPA
jgi:L-malate glycosyltransferase